MELTKDTLLKIIKNTPLVSIDLIIRDKNANVLLGLRNNEPAKGNWFVPGGRIRKDEHIADAFARISLAEIGMKLELAASKFLGVYEHLYSQNFAHEPDISTHYIVLAYETTIGSDFKDFPLSQHREVRWWSINELLASAQVHSYTKNYFR